MLMTEVKPLTASLPSAGTVCTVFRYAARGVLDRVSMRSRVITDD